MSPEKMFPHHIGDRAEGEPQENLDEPEVTSQDLGETRIPQEEYQEHQEILRKADDLEARLREEYKEQTGAEAPKEKNLSLWMVEQFRRLAKEAQDLRKAVRYVKNPAGVTKTGIIDLKISSDVLYKKFSKGVRQLIKTSKHETKVNITSEYSKKEMEETYLKDDKAELLSKKPVDVMVIDNEDKTLEELRKEVDKIVVKIEGKIKKSNG